MNSITNTHRFSLEKGSKKYTCPSCRKKTFVPYFDKEKDERLPEQVGRCDRENNCSYHYTPKQFIKDNPLFLKGIKGNWKPTIKKDASKFHPSKIDTIPYCYLELSLQHYEKNNFVLYLKSLFSDALSNQLIQDFKLGTSKAWEGANVFWQLDINGKVRQAKVMLYNPITGRRIKENEAPQKGRNKIYFAGKQILQLKRGNSTNLNFKQCFFGEHQLQKFPDHKVAIVESEKTAILMTVIQPNYIWLATGGKNGCKWTETDVFKVLKGRKVVLFPDLGCYEDWRDKALLLNQSGFKIVVSDLLERCATNADKNEGFDIADYFIKRDSSFGWALAKWEYPLFWDFP